MARLDEKTCCFYEDVCTGSVQETHEFNPLNAIKQPLRKVRKQSSGFALFGTPQPKVPLCIFPLGGT